MHGTPSIAAPDAPGDVRAAPLPRAVWITAGVVALTVTGVASALAWHGESAARRPAVRADAAAAPVPAAVPRSRPAADGPVPTCPDCGVVESVRPVRLQGEGSGVGAVAGGVVGAVVGNQIGGGNGRKAMTVLGAVGGGYAGHEIEKHAKSRTVFDVRVRLQDGTLRTVRQAQAPAVGARVRLDGTALRAV